MSLRGRDTLLYPPLLRQPPLGVFLPPLQPPRARSSFNKRSLEALSNYIYSLLGRKLPALRRCGKNWEIKINPLPTSRWVARACPSVLPSFSDCSLSRNTSFSNLGGAGGHYRLRNLFLHSGGGGSLLAKLFSTRFVCSSTERAERSSIITEYYCRNDTR